MESEIEFQTRFIKSQVHPKKKLLAQMIFDNVPEDEIIDQFGKARLQEMQSIIHYARLGTAKVCKTCGII